MVYAPRNLFFFFSFFVSLSKKLNPTIHVKQIQLQRKAGQMCLKCFYKPSGLFQSEEEAPCLCLLLFLSKTFMQVQICLRRYLRRDRITLKREFYVQKKSFFFENFVTSLFSCLQSHRHSHKMSKKQRQQKHLMEVVSQKQQTAANKQVIFS